MYRRKQLLLWLYYFLYLYWYSNILLASVAAFSKKLKTVVIKAKWTCGTFVGDISYCFGLLCVHLLCIHIFNCCTGSFVKLECKNGFMFLTFFYPPKKLENQNQRKRLCTIYKENICQPLVWTGTPLYQAGQRRILSGGTWTWGDCSNKWHK